MMAQTFRDHQLKNVFFMERIDDQIDEIYELRQHIEYIKKDVLNTKER